MSSRLLPFTNCKEGQLDNNGWYPELVILAVVFSNSTDLAVVIPNSTIKRQLFYSKTL